MTDIIGYLALSISLFAISRRKMKSLRWWHLAASIIYVIYGFIISAYPVAFGALLFASIHIFNLIKIYKPFKREKF